MKKYFISEKSRKVAIAKEVKLASNIFERMLGLMFTKDMENFDGLLIRPCNSIHTFFMNYDLDVLFLSKDYVVVGIVRGIPPWRMTRIYFKAYQVLELKTGRIPEYINLGDQLEVVCLN